MNWKALIFAVLALSVYAPFVDVSFCAEPSCCAHMESCCGHCGCPPQQTCSMTKPATVDQQAVTRTAELPPRIQVALFTLASFHLSIRASDCHLLAWLPESPPPKLAQSPQSRLCVWLI